MSAPLAPFLMRFSDREPVATFAFQPIADEPANVVSDDEIAERLEVCREETMAEAEAVASARLLALEETHQDALAAALTEARARWIADEGATHAALLGQAFADLREDLSRRVAIALKPLLTAALLERARAAIDEALDHIVADPDHPLVSVRGPSDLLDTIRAARAGTDALERIAYTPSDAVEITVDAAGTHVETRLAAALAVLEEI